MAMTISLNAKNKLGFVDGTLKDSSPDSAGEYPTWSRCNDMVVAWIINTLEGKIGDSVLYYMTARAV